MVDDDDDYREAAAAELEDYGFDVVFQQDGEGLFDYFADGNSVDVIVLDWNLPSGPGIDLLTRLRRRGIQIPVFFLTGFPRTVFEEEALDHGALDFIDKGRGVPIVARRIQRLVEAARRQQIEVPAEESLEIGPLLLRPKVSRAYWNGQDAQLTVTEFNIVHLLASNGGEYVTYRAIYDCVHRAGFVAGSGEDGYRTNVRSSIKRIRNKFCDIDGHFSQIENFPAFGYRWKVAADCAA